ncbi:MAG: glycerophosphodiester phosphodiesterase family protein [Cyclobacteriaceae bacterium]|nr:glycerophosphodiester phosphodiesterase family protein [Cyclobacteriaceae bacterium]
MANNNVHLNWLVVLLLSFNSAFSQIDIQGHRGARGLLPENSIPGFQKALELGVNTIELDVVITKDNKVVVSHEPWISGKICKDPKGNAIKENDWSFNIFQMKYAEVKKCQCGTIKHPDFPEQIKIPVEKPLLWDVIKIIEQEARKYKKEIKYNIEIKSDPKGVDLYHPNPHRFSFLVYQVIQKIDPDKVIIQSFDVTILQEWKKSYPQYKLAFLVENPPSWKESIQKLGFNPDIYSPNQDFISARSIQELHQIRIKVIPWTVNEIEKMQQFIDWGIDGLITDYPDRALSLNNSH